MSETEKVPQEMTEAEQTVPADGAGAATSEKPAAKKKPAGNKAASSAKSKAATAKKGDKEGQRRAAQQNLSRLKRQNLRPIELLYQPIVAMDESLTYGYEATLQINDLSLGSLSAATVVPLAEESNRIVELGKWSLLEMSDMVARQEARGKAVRHVFMPLSPKYISKSYFLDQVKKYLEKAQMDPERLCIEVSIRALTEPQNGLDAVLNAVHEAGISICVTGYGDLALSPTQLDTLPIDYLKLDASFVEALVNGEEFKQIANSISEICERRHIRLIADGVTEKRQQDALMAINCLLFQGPYIGVIERESRVFK